MYTYRRNGRPNPEGEPMITTLGNNLRTFTFTFTIDTDTYGWKNPQTVIDGIEDCIASLSTTTNIERGLVIGWRIDQSTPTINRRGNLIGMVATGRIEYVALGRTVSPEHVLCDLYQAIGFSTDGEVTEI